MASSVIEGICESRFLGVREAFAENFARHGEVGAAVAVTIDGRPVVDLWAGHANAARTRPWVRDTIGWLIGEVVRRITGTSLGGYWCDEIARPLGIDCHIGLSAEHDARVAEFIPVPPPPPGDRTWKKSSSRTPGR